MKWLAILLFLPCIAWATGGGKKPTPAPTPAPSATATGGSAKAGASAGAAAGATADGGDGGYAGGGTTKFFSFAGPGYAGASTCPIGVIPLFGGTTGAEFCRALYTSMVTGDKGPVCGHSWYREGLDDWCADWDKRHPKVQQGFRWSVDPS